MMQRSPSLLCLPCRYVTSRHDTTGQVVSCRVATNGI